MKSFLRVWLATDFFFSAICANCVSGKARVKLTHNVPSPVKVGNTDDRFEDETIEKKMPLAHYVSLFFDSTHYELAVEIHHREGDSVNLNYAYSLGGNAPRYAERWGKEAQRRSVSVGDVVESFEDGESTFYVCHPHGWREIESSIRPDENDLITIPKIEIEEWEK